MKNPLLKSICLFLLAIGLIAFTAVQPVHAESTPQQSISHVAPDHPDLGTPHLLQVSTPAVVGSYLAATHTLAPTAGAITLAADQVLVNDTAPAQVIDSDSIKIGGISLGAIVSLLGAVIIIARFIVKITPTPQDDSILEKIVGFLKHVGLVIEK